MPQSKNSDRLYFENYKELTLDMPTLKEFGSNTQSYLSVYHFDNCGKVTFIGNDATSPKEQYEIPENLTLGKFNFGVVLISPIVMISESDSYDASWYHAKHLSVSANLNPIITNITIKEAITIDSSTVILQKRIISSSRLLDDSEEYKSHSLLTGVGFGSGLNCEDIKLKTTINNIGKFALEYSNDGTELVAIKGKENAPVLSPENPEKPTDGENPEKPTGGENPEKPTDDENPEKPTGGENPEKPTEGDTTIFTPDITPPSDFFGSINAPSGGYIEKTLNDSLINKFNEMGTENENINKIVEIIGTTEIPFNSELKNNEFIKPPQNSNVEFKGGNLNLFIPEQVTVTIPKTEESKLTIKGTGSVTFNFEETEKKQESIKMNTKSQINGPVKITVPEDFTTFTMDSLELDSISSIEVINKNAEKSVQVNVNELSTLKNSEATLKDLKIGSTLKIVQSSVLNVKNVDLNDASISYNIDDYLAFDKDKPFFKGNFITLPRTFSITGSKESNNKPYEKVDYTIVSGTFENMKCEDWYPKIVLDNSGFKLKSLQRHSSFKSSRF